MVQGLRKRFVWDLPTRLFHWLLVALLAFSWWSAETYRMEWHYRSGLAICALVVFRIVWGFIGTETARFAQFIKGPSKVIAYLRAEKPASEPAAMGHSPLGAWSVVAILMTIAAQVVTGLFAVDVDGFESGPLSFLVSFDQGRAAAEIHEIVFNLILALSALHILAVLFYLVVRRRNLIGRMVTGHDRVPDGEGRTGATRAGPLRLATALAVAIVLTYAVNNGFWIA